MDALDLWSARYLKEGQIWTDQPSPTVKKLLERLDDTCALNVLEIGFGYGRDLLALARAGHKISGVEKATEGLCQARLLLTKYKDKVHLINGDFITAPLKKDHFDAVMLHRVLHLVPPKKLTSLVDKISNLLVPGGLMAVSARSPEDYNPVQMNIVTECEDGVPTKAVYKNRPGHFIHFFDEQKLTETFNQKFDVSDTFSGKEMESVGNRDPEGKLTETNIIVMIGRRKQSSICSAPAP